MAPRPNARNDGREALPDWIPPMLAVAGTLPATDDGWAYEMKWDGVRAEARIEHGVVSFTSRNRNDLTGSVPELAHLGRAFGDTPVILDGELVAFDENGRPSFQLLQRRQRDAATGQATAVSYVVFDLLHLDGLSLLDEPYENRRQLLEGLDLRDDRWTTSPSFAGPGADVVEASKRQGLEGVVVKRRSSTYEAGRRSSAWIKVKTFLHQEVVVGGWTTGEGRRADRFGALLVGIPDGDGGLRYAGKVGTGFDEETLADLSGRLAAISAEHSPFTTPVPSAEVRRAHFVLPELVGEVTYGEWTRDDRLRHPAWRGLRIDKDPSDVRIER